MDDLSKQGEMFKLLLEHIHEGVYFVDQERKIIFWNKGAEHITGYAEKEVSGHCCADNILMHVDREGALLCKNACPLAETLKDGKTREARVYLQHKEGYRVPVAIGIKAVRDDQNAIVGAVETFHDETRTMAAMAELEDFKQFNMVCAVTGVANRAFTEQMVQRKLDEMKRDNANLALFFIDIDRFKSINDTYGHATGDLVLKMVARTLANAMRVYDFLGRWGGEEFVAVMPSVRGMELEVAAHRLCALVESSSRALSHNKMRVTISVGGCLSRPDDTVKSIIERADKLMYESKKNGRNRATVERVRPPVK